MGVTTVSRQGFIPVVWDNEMTHYYSEKQTSPIRERIIKATILGNTLTFHTGSGMFSPDRIDTGTEILIENAQIREKDKVLDFGCGYGAVGIAIAKAYTGVSIVMTDINKRAVALAKKNAEFNGISAKIYNGNLLELIHEQCTAILLNPPQTAGKKICFAMIEQSKEHLVAGGTLQLVARHNKGGNTLSQKMMEVFGNVSVLAKKGGYWVYCSSKD